MKISVRIDRFIKGSSIKAIASVILDGMFVVKNLRVVNGSKGCFVAMPQESYTDKSGAQKYRDVFFPMNAKAKETLERAVIAVFDEAMYRNTPEWDVQDDEMLPPGM